MVTIGSELPPGTLVDRRYQIKYVLGRGGFGRTYLASDQRRFGELCVLKEFVPKNQGDSVVAQKLHELFQREAQILHQLNHPQIPKFFAVFEENDRLFIAQEYISGKTYWKLLQERQQRGTAFSEIEVFRWLRHLLPVLDYLHKQNIVHRDISPDNIMLPRHGRLPVLIDFGVVKQAAPHWYEISSINPDGSVEASVSVGKLGYAPYEQIRIGQCSPRSDLYALAVTAAVLLTAKAPNSLIDPKSLEWRWQSYVKVHPEFAAILVRMMAEKPQDRYPSARSVLEELELLGQQYLTPASRSPIARRAGLSRSGTATLHPSSSTVGAKADRAKANPFSLEPTLLEKPIQASMSQMRVKSQTANAVASQPGSSRSRSSLRTTESPQLPASRQTAHTSTIRTHNQATTLILPPSGIHTTAKLLADTPATKLTVLTGASSKSTGLSLKRALVLSLLTLVPLGGVAIGIQSPHISSLCQSLNNCADQSEYGKVARQAEQAKRLVEQAKTLEDLKVARDRLAQTVALFAKLPADPANKPPGAANSQRGAAYRELLSRVEQRLEKEVRAAELLQRAGDEAKTAEQQTTIAETLQQLTVARSQWRKALATLSAIPTSTYVADQAATRSQQYSARLQTVDQRLVAINPQIEPSLPPSISSAKPEVSFSSPIVASATPSPIEPPQPAPEPSAVEPSPSGIVATKPTAQPSLPAATPAPETPVASAPAANRSPQPSPTRIAAANPPQRRDSPPAVNRFLSVTQPITPTIAAASPGNVNLAATQTLDEVSVRLSGARVSTRGTFVANVQVENRSDRSFGFVPLFVEVRDANGQAVTSRLRLNSSGDGMVAPGEILQGEVYLLDRYWNNSGSQELTLVIREGTTGNRNFHVQF